MKRLVLIVVSGAFGVLLIVFLFWCCFNMLNGRPIAHATGMRAIILRDTLVFIVIFGGLVGYIVWLRLELGDWFDFIKWLWKE